MHKAQRMLTCYCTEAKTLCYTLNLLQQRHFNTLFCNTPTVQLPFSCGILQPSEKQLFAFISPHLAEMFHLCITFLPPTGARTGGHSVPGGPLEIRDRQCVMFALTRAPFSLKAPTKVICVLWPTQADHVTRGIYTADIPYSIANIQYNLYGTC